MASNASQKPGLTTFGWLALGATAAAVLASPARREKLKTAAGGLLDKFGQAKKTPASPAS
ncbi:hypothetical protein [Sphingomonas sp.]|uniref:hypothetical protein n=1 Tax=Sphingomonas sp. TaxID=28214 RepID=UPI0025EB9E2E|nr:hypothetical protein [Sphingomonas sp.]